MLLSKWWLLAVFNEGFFDGVDGEGGEEKAGAGDDGAEEWVGGVGEREPEHGENVSENYN